MSMGEKKRGRPSKYQPEYCELLIKHMEQGLSFEAFAGVIRVNQDTLHEWCKVHPDFSEAKKSGIELGRLFLEKVGIGLALGKIDGNVTAWIFTMKNRMGWRDQQHVEHTGANGGAIELKSLSDEEIQRRIDAIRERKRLT